MPLGLGLNMWQSVKAAGGGAISYLLRFIGADADNKTFVDGEVADTEAEGLLDGTGLTMKILTTANIELIGGELKLEGAGNWASCGAWEDVAVTKQTGLALYEKVRISGAQSSSNGMILAFGSQTVATGMNYLFWELGISFGGSTAEIIMFNYQAAVSLSAGVTSINNTTYEFMVILDTDNNQFFGFIKGDVFTTWTLIGILPMVNPSNDYKPTIQTYYATSDMFTQKLLIPDTLYTEQITPEFNIDWSTYPLGKLNGYDGWVSVDGTDAKSLSVVSGEKVDDTLATGASYDSKDFGISDMLVEVIADSKKNDSPAAVIAHGRVDAVDYTKYWQARYQSGSIQLRENNSLTRGSLSAPLVAVTKAMVRLHALGDVLTASVDMNGTVYSVPAYTSTLYNTNTRAGLYMYLDSCNTFNVYKTTGFTFEGVD